MAAAGPAARAPPAYTYTSLSQAVLLPPGGCNLYGVVKECTQPKPTKGTGEQGCGDALLAPRATRLPS